MGNGYVRTAPESEKSNAPHYRYGGSELLDQCIAEGGLCAPMILARPPQAKISCRFLLVFLMDFDFPLPDARPSMGSGVPSRRPRRAGASREWSSPWFAKALPRTVFFKGYSSVSSVFQKSDPENQRRHYADSMPVLRPLPRRCGSRLLRLLKIRSSASILCPGRDFLRSTTDTIKNGI